MRFDDAAEQYVADQWRVGKFTSLQTDRGYRNTLGLLSDHVSNRDPRTVGRADVKAVLDRWSHPNTRRARRAHMVAFFKWAMQEGLCSSNPAQQTPTSKIRTKQRRRLTEAEMLALCEAAEGPLEIRAIYIGIFAGLRNQELRGLRGEHFARDGVVLVTEDIAKGVKERELPILGELQPVVNAIRADVASDEYVLPAQRWRNPPQNTERESLRKRAMSQQALGSLVARVACRAGVSGHITPHCLRYANADLIGARCGAETASYMLGHSDLRTTQIYLARPSLDRLTELVAGVRLCDLEATGGLPLQKRPAIPVKATTGFEPVYTALQAAA